MSQYPKRQMGSTNSGWWAEGGADVEDGWLQKGVKGEEGVGRGGKGKGVVSCPVREKASNQRERGGGREGGGGGVEGRVESCTITKLYFRVERCVARGGGGGGVRVGVGVWFSFFYNSENLFCLCCFCFFATVLVFGRIFFVAFFFRVGCICSDKGYRKSLDRETA